MPVADRVRHGGAEHESGFVAVSFNHTIIGAHNPAESAEFYRAVLGAREAPNWGPFINLLLDDHTLLQFAPAPVNDAIHMAFLMDDAEFDREYGDGGRGQRQDKGGDRGDRGGRGRDRDRGERGEQRAFIGRCRLRIGN